MLFNRARFLYSAIGLLTAVLMADGAFAGGSGAPAEKDTVGVYVPASRTFFLRNSNTAGNADVKVKFGPTGSVPTMGNFDGSGSNFTDTIGVYRASTGEFFLKNTNTAGTHNLRFRFGAAGGGYVPVIGNWNGAGGDSIGLYDPVGGKFLLRNTNNGGNADITISFGPKNAATAPIPIRGNWAGGDAIDGIGIYEPATGTFRLKNDPTTSGPADVSFNFGAPNLIPVVGNWNDDDTDTVGVYNPATQTFFLRNTNAAGAADLTYRFGGTGAVPVSGNYDGE